MTGILAAGPQHTDQHDDASAAATRRSRQRRRGRVLAATPSRLAALVVVSLLGAGVLAAVIAIQAGSQRSGLDAIGEHDAPEVVATSDFYFALNDMDAQVANILLVGDATDLGFTADQAQTIFNQRRSQADADLQQVAVAASDPATATTIRTIIDDLGAYEALVARALALDGLHAHPAGQPAPETLAAYRSATDLLETALLPAARTLTQRNAAALEHTYVQQHDVAQRMRYLVIGIGAITVALLIALQVFLARRFRRRLNLGVLAATAMCALLAGAGGWQLGAQTHHLQVAKKDAFDSILALDQARAISYDANADESRYLVDPQRAAQYQDGFLSKTMQLVDLPGATIATFDQRLAAALGAYRSDHGDIGWQGLYGTEFRNITFPGERAAAQKTLTLFQTYQRDDRHIRALAGAGQIRAAIAFCTSYQPGQSNYAFDQYDQALGALIAINQNAFTTNVHDGQRDLRGWSFVPWLALGATAVLLGAGTWRRMAEYR